MIILTNILFFIISLLDAHYNLYIINGANPNDVINNRKWHKWGGAMHFGIAVYIGIISSFFIGALYLAYRATIFPIVLNLLREKPIFYLSKNGFEGIFVKRNLEWLYFLGGFFFILLFNYLKFH